VITIGRRGALIRGASGSGKSDLALRCLSLGGSTLLSETVKLVADDQVVLTRERAALVAKAPAQLRGKLEVRGLGILEVATAAETEIVLIADLVRDQQIERLPDPWPTVELMGLNVPVIHLQPFEASSPTKLAAALALATLPRIEPKA
jgi:serine kinase of HPr protein (carbohydrate metabolism regulator)